jgi:hypothetical protein
MSLSAESGLREEGRDFTRKELRLPYISYPVGRRESYAYEI